MSDVKEAAEASIKDFSTGSYFERATKENCFYNGFVQGSRWQLAQLRCETCKYYGVDSTGLHCLNNIDWPGDVDEFGCVYWKGKE